MVLRRMTRLTNAHSRKWENHEYHLAICLRYYNFCRVHMTIKTTPAVKAWVTYHPRAVGELLDELATHYTLLGQCQLFQRAVTPSLG